MKWKTMGGSITFSPEVVAEICARIAEGESLRSVCKDADMPDKATVCRWLALHEDFQARYARARNMQEESICDEIREIADDASGDWKPMERHGRVYWVLDQDNIRRARLRIDARKWMLAKLAPKKYGYGIGQERSDPNGAPVEFRGIALVIVDTPRLRSPLEAAA